MSRMRENIRSGCYENIPFGSIGVELNAEAVKDARKNTAENGFDPKKWVE